MSVPAHDSNTEYSRNTCEEVLIGIYKVTKVTSLSKASIYRLMKIGRFPKAKELIPGGRRVAWRLSEVEAWMASRLDWNDPITF